MNKSILKLEKVTTSQNHILQYRTVFKTKHGRVLYLSLTIRDTTCRVQDCFYCDRHGIDPGARRTARRPGKLKTLLFQREELLTVIQAELDKTFYGVEFVANDTATLPLREYLETKLHQMNPKYRFLILVGQGATYHGLPMHLRTRLKNKLHRAVYLELEYYKEGQGVIKQCRYYDRQYQHRAVPVAPPTLVSCFFPYTREGILTLVNQEICCDFTHMLVTEGIDLDSNTAPLCGAI